MSTEMSEMRTDAVVDAWRNDCAASQANCTRMSSKLADDPASISAKLDSSIDGKENGRRLSSDGNSIKAEILEGCRDMLGNNANTSCSDCRSCSCHNPCPTALKRRCSTSDIGSLLTSSNSLPLKKTLSSGKSLEKIDRINLANLVFNPNFKNSAGCVNLPVIRAGQNLAQKNSQRAALNVTKDLNNNTVPTDINQSQTTIDMLTQQFQKPESIDKLAAKLQLMALQKKRRSGSTSNLNEPEGSQDVADLLQTLAARAAVPNQNNALRYKTELCRSYEEGGECRFGAACTFAHGPEELRPVPRHPLYKTEFCRTYHQHGYCQYGTRCHFIHDVEEADKNAPLRGCKSWGRHDKLSGALLSLASSSGLLDAETKQVSPSDNDVLLANLRRLYALRVMNNDKPAEQSGHFSMSQPMAHQLALAHQQMSASSGQHLPLSMTQPLPMDALQMGMQRAGHRAPHMASNNRVDSLANDYGGWGMAPSSPSYPGLSPFGSYQQFSPLPHHQPQAYPHYPFSATAPDLSQALATAGPYGMQPQNFASTVNVGHMLPQDHSYPNVQQQKQGSVQQPQNSVQNHPVQVPNHMWPATSAEVPSVIDKELFGFGLENNGQNGNSGYQQYPPQYYQGNANYAKQMNPGYNDPTKMRTSEADILGLMSKNEKYMNDQKSLKTINEAAEPKEQSVRPKTMKHQMNGMSSMA